jgi:hypothetical protein
MGAPMVVDVPMVLEPIAVLLEGMVLPELDDSVEPVEGVTAGTGITVVLVSSTFLLQAPSASKAASATDVTAMVLCVDENMRFPLNDGLLASDGAQKMDCAAPAHQSPI